MIILVVADIHILIHGTVGGVRSIGRTRGIGSACTCGCDTIVDTFVTAAAAAAAMACRINSTISHGERI